MVAFPKKRPRFPHIAEPGANNAAADAAVILENCCAMAEAADMITQHAVTVPLRAANKVSNRGIMIKLQLSIAAIRPCGLL